MTVDTPYFIRSCRRGPVTEYEVRRTGEDVICTAYTYGYAVKIVEALNDRYRQKVAKAVLEAAARAPNQAIPRDS